MLTIINTFWSKERINQKLLQRHLAKFTPKPNAEVLLVVDNCDESETNLKILEQYKRFGFKIIPIFEHKFAGGCRNVGLEHATGDWIVFIDSWNDSIDSGTDWTLENLLITLNCFLRIAPECDMIEISNHFNKFYRAHPWNIFYKRSFLESHNLRFIEWQGYEDFLFNFVIFNLSKSIGMYLEKSKEILIFPTREKRLCRIPLKHSICYNHRKADTHSDYGIRTMEKFNEASEYFQKYLNYVPIEFVVEQYGVNKNTEFGKTLFELIKNKPIPKPCFFKYLFKNIEEDFRDGKTCIITK